MTAQSAVDRTQSELKFHKIVSDIISIEIMKIVPDTAMTPDNMQLSKNDSTFCFFTSFATKMEMASRVTIREARHTRVISRLVSKMGLGNLCPVMLIFVKLALFIY